MKPKPIRFSLLGFCLLFFFLFLPLFSPREAWSDTDPKGESSGEYTPAPDVSNSPPPGDSSGIGEGAEPPAETTTTDKWKCVGKCTSKTCEYTFEAEKDKFNGACTKDAKPTDSIDIQWECKDGKGKLTYPTASKLCGKNSLCGDAIPDLGDGEKCDDGNLKDGDGCDCKCQKEYCGDKKVQAGLGEECDDGGVTNNDGCSATCKNEFCGDKITQASEGCDDGNKTSGDGCSATCVVEKCGDGIKQTGLGEECDDGNTVSGDGCSDVCENEVCGDKIINVDGEECDDGNTADGDGCSSICKNEFCGDKITQAGLGEECDGGAHCVACQSTLCDGALTVECVLRESKCIANTKCFNEKTGVTTEALNPEYDVTCKGNTACHVPVCGDGKADSGEECDLGKDKNNDTGACTTACKLPACGDGFAQTSASEECDQGENTNGQAGSTCDKSCRKLACTITCNPVVNAATQNFKTNCTDTRSSALDGIPLEYTESNTGSFNNGDGSGTCATGGGNAKVTAVLNYNGAEVCHTTTEFKCNVCTDFVKNNLSTDDHDAAEAAGLGCPKSWICDADDSNPNEGWSDPDQTTGICYCTACSTTV